jgi:inhibitor of KinA
MRLSYAPLGDQAVRVEFGDPFGVPDPATNRRIGAFCLALEHAALAGVVEWVPAFATVAVVYDPGTIAYRDLLSALDDLAGEIEKTHVLPTRLVEIPVCYGGECGPDLTEVAAHCGLSEADVVALHSAQPYLVYMIGFAPGFPYLGGLPDALVTERRAAPRLAIPAGSVALAGSQTGVYPFETPGGWNIIGRTSLKLYDPEREPSALLRAGDYVKFIPARPALD